MIKVGTVLQLEPLDNTENERYKCKVVEFDENVLYIDYPIHMKTDKTIFLMDGTQLKASFVFNDQTVYMFDTEVLGRKKSKIPMVHIDFKGEDQLIKIQRRQFVRVDTSIDISLMMKENPFPTITEDISAGGCAVILNREIELAKGNQFPVLLVFPMQTGEYHYLEIDSRVVRLWEKDKKRIASIQFINLAENDRQIIMRYCFEKQLEMRRKRLKE
jgi:c-di-GMP-binding flagellar brake protein YcgR